VAFGLPIGDALAFRFQVGDSVYKQLVSSPGLRAIFAVDLETRQILGVRFRGKT
jgi:hypothetical protein